MQEGCQLPTRHDAIRAEPAGGAARRDAGRRQAVDGSLMLARLVVTEEVGRSRGKVERARQEVAIWARVTSPSGQNRPGAQPEVMPDAARRLIEASCLFDSSSPKKSVEVEGRSSARDRNVAICPRVTRPFGQYRAGAKPTVIPSRTSQPMSLRNGAPGGTSSNPPSKVAVRWPRRSPHRCVFGPPCDHDAHVFGKPPWTGRGHARTPRNRDDGHGERRRRGRRTGRQAETGRARPDLQGHRLWVDLDLGGVGRTKAIGDGQAQLEVRRVLVVGGGEAAAGHVVPCANRVRMAHAGQ